MDRYSFIVEDLHLLLLAGLPGALRDGHVIFEHEGKMETFRIDMIVPDHWQQMGGVPTITVIQSQGE